MARYLERREQEEFFVSRFVDYASEDGLFRKYRVVFVDGKPYACHMAIADRWDIWYLNAEMSAQCRPSVWRKRPSCAPSTSASRGAISAALAGMADRIGLDYFTVDCAETRDGALLIFEADNTAVVHNMDPPEVFPYKPPQMRKIFDAFVAMLERRVATRAGAARHDRGRCAKRRCGPEASETLDPQDWDEICARKGIACSMT